MEIKKSKRLENKKGNAILNKVARDSLLIMIRLIHILNEERGISISLSGGRANVKALRTEDF